MPAFLGGGAGGAEGGSEEDGERRLYNGFLV